MPSTKEAARRAERVFTRDGEPANIRFRLYTLRGRAEYLRPCIQLVELKHFTAEGRSQSRKWFRTPRGRWGTPYRSLRGIGQQGLGTERKENCDELRESVEESATA